MSCGELFITGLFEKGVEIRKIKKEQKVVITKQYLSLITKLDSSSSVIYRVGH